MGGEILTIWFWMAVVGAAVFAPLGYFIYSYTVKDGEPFGDTEVHRPVESKLLDTIEIIAILAKNAFGLTRQRLKGKRL